MFVPSNVAPGSRAVLFSSALLVLLAAGLAGCAVGEPKVQSGSQDAGTDSGQQLLDSSTPDAAIDAAIDAGPKVATCEACVLDQQCPQGENGTTPHICTDLNGTRLCLPRCSDTGAGCPIGFTCIAQVGTSASYCIPQAAGCCLDQDRDTYGTGATCMGPDCNDNSANVNPGRNELCNNVDDDCDTMVDDSPTDCAPQSCMSAGAGAYTAKPTSMCIDGQCSATSAMACGNYACSQGGSVGDACGTTCVVNGMQDDGYCAGFAHCVQANNCEADLSDGSACVEDSDCTSNHCDNGYCCSGGTCCATKDDCPASTFGIPPICSDQAHCQGVRYDPTCSAQHTCQLSATPVPDDSACVQKTANTCGNYADLVCTSSADQPSATCPASCTTNLDCDQPGAFCNASNQCQATGGLGSACTSTGECSVGSCVDGRCCSTSCTGACMACNVPGAYGTCTPVPANTDPDSECGAISCSGYYAGFNGDNCQARADASASVVSCNGAGACQTAAAVCPSQPATTGSLTCNATCQDPNLATCTNTTAGACTNVSGGNQSCGTGRCAVTVPVCSNGATQACTPGSPQTETCNDIDDDCNGTADDNISPNPDPNEPNDTGAADSRTELGDLGSGGTSRVVTDGRIYYAGDVDFYRVTSNVHGCNGDCYYRAYVNATITVPAGAGTYQICLDTDTTDVGMTCYSVDAGKTFTTPKYQRSCGGCGGYNGGETFIRVRGIAGQAWECLPYTLQVSAWREGIGWCGGC